MEYDIIIFILMWCSIPLSFLFNKSKLPLLIVVSNSFLLINDYLVDSVNLYYTLEGIRHVLTWSFSLYLFSKEKDKTLYSIYNIFYIFLFIHYLCGLHYIISDIDMNKLALMLNTVEILIFAKGLVSDNKNNNDYSMYG